MPLDGIPSRPYYTDKDMLGVVVFLIIFSIVLFFIPDMGGYFLESNNFIPADPLKTPTHIAPVWYFTPFYSMLRAITTQMMYALSLILVASVAWVFDKSRAPAMAKGILAVVALGVLWLFGAFDFMGIDGIDPKFW